MGVDFGGIEQQRLMKPRTERLIIDFAIIGDSTKGMWISGLDADLCRRLEADIADDGRTLRWRGQANPRIERSRR